jgi:hypothetical protein
MGFSINNPSNCLLTTGCCLRTVIQYKVSLRDVIQKLFHRYLNRANRLVTGYSSKIKIEIKAIYKTSFGWLSQFDVLLLKFNIEKNWQYQLFVGCSLNVSDLQFSSQLSIVQGVLRWYPPIHRLEMVCKFSANFVYQLNVRSKLIRVINLNLGSVQRSGDGCIHYWLIVYQLEVYGWILFSITSVNIYRRLIHSSGTERSPTSSMVSVT